MITIPVSMLIPRETPQRRALLDELRNCSDHPTAETLHQRVRRRLPRVSLGTIYRNLEELCSAGLATKMGRADGPSRYDGRVESHHHVRCSQCDAISDLCSVKAPKLVQQAERESGFTVDGFSIEFTGTCTQCKAN